MMRVHIPTYCVILSQFFDVFDPEQPENLTLSSMMNIVAFAVSVLFVAMDFAAILQWFIFFSDRNSIFDTCPVVTDDSFWWALSWKPSRRVC